MRDVSAVNSPGKFLLINHYLPKKMLCGPSNRMHLKTPILNCKEISFLSTDNKYQYNNYYTNHIFYFLDTVYTLIT